MPLTAQWVILAVCAYAGYQRAGWFERRYGRTPWGWPAPAWGLVTGFSLLIGVVLLAFAERAGRNAAAGRPVAASGPAFGGVAPQFGAPAAAFGGVAPQFGAPAPRFGGQPAPLFGTLPGNPTFGTPPDRASHQPADDGDPTWRRPALNEWQDDPSGGFFGTR